MLSKKMGSTLGLSSLVAVFLVVLIVNENGSKYDDEEKEDLSSHRGLASASVKSNIVSESLWKKRLATQIAEFSNFPSAKSARQPNPIEKLVFGDLKGYYLMKLDGDKVKGMYLNSQNMGDDIPKYLGEEISFLKRNRDLWAVNFEEVSLKQREGFKSVVSLFDASQNEIGMAEFVWDTLGHITSLKIEKK